MRELNNVVELDLLGCGIGSRVNRDDSGVVKYIGMDAARRPLTERSDELSNALFRKKEVCSKGVRAHFSQIISFAFAADHANRVLIQQNMSVFVGPRKAASFMGVTLVDDNEGPDSWMADRKARYGIGHGDRSGPDALRIDQGR